MSLCVSCGKTRGRLISDSLYTYDSEHEQLTFIIRLGRLLCAICDTDQRQNPLDPAVAHFTATRFASGDLQNSVWRNGRCVQLASSSTLPAFLLKRFPSPVSVPQVPSPISGVLLTPTCISLAAFERVRVRHHHISGVRSHLDGVPQGSKGSC